MRQAIIRSHRELVMMKVLIVDDNESLTGLLKEVLETEGDYSVKTAENGEAGYRAFVNFKPDVILTDIEMPVKNGLDMVKDIRALDPDIKTIYMSGDLDSYLSPLEEEKKRYPVSLLEKPFSKFELMGLLSAQTV